MDVTEKGVKKKEELEEKKEDLLFFYIKNELLFLEFAMYFGILLWKMYKSSYKIKMKKMLW